MPLSNTAERPGGPARVATGARTAVAIAVGLSFLGCGPREDPDLRAGRELYEENCATCHGPGALGDGPMASSLPVQPASLVEHLGHHTMAELTRLITGGVPPAMPPAPVSQEEILLIVDYVWTLVPEDQVEALRAMQRQMEEMGAGMGAMPGMQVDHSQGDMPEMQMDSMAPGQTGGSGSVTPER